MKENNSTYQSSYFQRCLMDDGIPILGRIQENRSMTDDYVVKSDVLGSGYNGPVKVVVHETTGKIFALKSFSKKDKSLTKLHMFQNEIAIFLRMDHPNVCKLIDIYDTPHTVHMIMEHCAGGELYDRLHAAKQFSEDVAVATTHQMLLALNYLHSNRIVHRDLKLENFMYESKDADARLKLIDFGFSKIWDPATRMQASCGSISYVGPDVLSGSYTNKCDLWSLGIIVFMLLSGYPPFYGTDKHTQQGRANLFDKIKSGKFAMKPERWKNVSRTARDFVRSLLVVDPDKRMSAAEALKHPWVADYKATRRADKLGSAIVLSFRRFAMASHFHRAICTVIGWHMKDADHKSFENVFLELDYDQDGTISISELKHGLVRHFGCQVGEIVRFFESMDNNHDGRLSFTDFMGAMMATRAMRRDDWMHAAFDRFDRDGTGAINVSSLKHVLGESFGTMTCEELAESVSKDGEISWNKFMRHVRDNQRMGVEAFPAAHDNNKRDTARLSSRRAGSLNVSQG